jgi:hypothetical protein
MGDLLLSMGSDDDCIGAPVQRVQLRETQYHQCSKSIRRKVSISRCAQATTMFVLLSTLVASVTYFEIEDVPSSLTSSIFTKATSIIQDLFVSSDGAQGVHQNQKQAVHGLSLASNVPVEMNARRQLFEENTPNILRRQDEENRFRRQEAILSMEHMASNRHARIEAQEEKRREVEEQRRVMEENRLKMMQREGEERLHREEKSALRKKRLERERQARIDALEEKRRMLQDQSGVLHQDLQGDEEAAIPRAQDQEAEVAEAEDVFQPIHVRRQAKLYTFVY